MSPEWAAASERAGGAVGEAGVAVAVGVGSGRARILGADVCSAGAVVSRNAGFGGGSVDGPCAVEAGGARRAHALSEDCCCSSRRARNWRDQTGGAVEAERARILRGSCGGLSSGAVVASLAVGVGGCEIGDGAGLSSCAVQAGVARRAAWRWVVGSRLARDWVGSSLRAVVASGANNAANAVDRGGDAGVADAPESGRAWLLREVGCAGGGAVVTGRARGAVEDGCEAGKIAHCRGGARELGGEVGSGGAVVASWAFALASVVEFNIRSSSVEARISDIAIFSGGADAASRLSITNGVAARGTAKSSGRSDRAGVAPSADDLSCSSGAGGAVVSSGAETGWGGEAHCGAVRSGGADLALGLRHQASRGGECADGAGERGARGVGAVVAGGADVASDVVRGIGDDGAGFAVVAGVAGLRGVNDDLAEGGAEVARSAVVAARNSRQASSVRPRAGWAGEVGGDGGSVGAVVTFGAHLGLSEVVGRAEILGVAEVAVGAELALRKLRSVGVVAGGATKLG